MNRETRATGARLTFDNGSGIFEGRAVTYGVVDEYGSVWSPGCFNESLRAGPMPSIALGHAWTDVVGIVVDWKDSADGLYVVAQLDNPEAVPSARKAWAQLHSGSVEQLSVGFSHVTRRPPTDDELDLFPGAREVIVSATLDEVSLVLRGAVPGAKVLATRAAASATRPSSRGDWSGDGFDRSTDVVWKAVEQRRRQRRDVTTAIERRLPGLIDEIHARGLSMIYGASLLGDVCDGFVTLEAAEFELGVAERAGERVAHDARRRSFRGRMVELNDEGRDLVEGARWCIAQGWFTDRDRVIAQIKRSTRHDTTVDAEADAALAKLERDGFVADSAVDDALALVAQREAER